MDKKHNYIKIVVKSAVIAALYVSVGLVFKPWEFYSLQLRPSEALNILICYSAGAPWGLFVGCVLTNLTSPFGLVDIVFGSLATLASALIGRKIKNRYLAMLPSVIINGLVVSAIICAASDIWNLYAVTALSVALSQAFSIYAIGIPLMLLIERSKRLKEIIRD